MNRATIVLIGAPGAGKSTIGMHLSRLVHRPFIDIDAVGETYYQEVGWTLPLLVKRIREVGYLAAHIEWQPARIHAVEREIAEHQGEIIALGAGHTDYHSMAYLDRLIAALAGTQSVLILPNSEPEASLETLRNRCRIFKQRDWIIDGVVFLDRWLRSPVSRQLATLVVVQNGASAEESAEIIAHRTSDDQRVT